jgi:tRNA dimethylallyltransferase
MIDIVEPDEEFSVADYKQRVEELIIQIKKRKRIPLLVGGTGLYIQAIVDPYKFDPIPTDWMFRQKLRQEALQYGNEFVHDKLQQVDPVSAKKIHPNDLRRVIRALEVYHKTGRPIWYNHFTKDNNNGESLLVGLTMPRELLYQRINQRVDNMVKSGLVDEVKSLLEAGYDPNLTSLQSLGYKQIIAFLMGKISLEEAIELIKRDTRRFAKRQIAWFKRDKRIKWYMIDDSTEYSKLIKEIVTFFARSIYCRS